MQATATAPASASGPQFFAGARALFVSPTMASTAVAGLGQPTSPAVVIGRLARAHGWQLRGFDTVIARHEISCALDAHFGIYVIVGPRGRISDQAYTGSRAAQHALVDPTAKFAAGSRPVAVVRGVHEPIMNAVVRLLRTAPTEQAADRLVQLMLQHRCSSLNTPEGRSRLIARAREIIAHLATAN